MKRKAIGDIFSDSSSDSSDNETSFNNPLVEDEEDKKRLAQMTEREREEELFKRAEKQEAILAREAVRKKLKENKTNEVPPVKKSSPKKSLSHVLDYEFSSSDSDGSSDYGQEPGEIPSSRKERLKRKNNRLASQLHAQVAKRQQRKAKEERQRLMLVSDIYGSENEDDDTGNKPISKTSNSNKQSKDRGEEHLLSSSSEDISSSSLSSESGSGRKKNLMKRSDRKRHGYRGASSSDDETKRSSEDEPQNQEISTLEHISKIQLSRTYLEKWVHMPFFDQVAAGCFVRVNIGINPDNGGPIYRCAEVIGVVESTKVYDLGTTKTNKAMRLRIGQSEKVFRLLFVSNTPISKEEFDSWLRRSKQENVNVPTVEQVEAKRKKIHEAFDFRIEDSKTLEAILQSKRRFQSRPSNFAVRKTELNKLIEEAEARGDFEKMRQYEDELKEIDDEADRLDRKRTIGVKKISFINQRNRRLNQELAEEALRQEEEENAKMEAEGGDPFRRLATRPCMLTKEIRDQLALKKKLKENGAADASANDPAAIKKDLVVQNNNPFPPLTIRPKPINDNLQSIHNFDISIDLSIDAAMDLGGGQSRDGSNTGQDSTGGSIVMSSRRSLNLDEYKKKRGLI